MATDVDWRKMRKLLNIRPHLLRAERAIDARAEQVHVRNRSPECFDGLPGKSASASVRDRSGHHDRQAHAGGLKIFVDRKKRGLGIQRIENGFDQKDIDAALDEP